MRRALLLFAAAALAVTGGGWLFAATWHLGYAHALFCAFGTASTTGCDAAPHDGAAMVSAALVMLTAIPLLAAASGSLHLDRVRVHVDRRLAEHHRALSGQIGAATAGQDRPRRKRAAYAVVLVVLAVLLMVRAVRGKLRG